MAQQASQPSAELLMPRSENKQNPLMWNWAKETERMGVCRFIFDVNTQLKKNILVFYFVKDKYRLYYKLNRGKLRIFRSTHMTRNTAGTGWCHC